MDPRRAHLLRRRRPPRRAGPPRERRNNTAGVLPRRAPGPRPRAPPPRTGAKRSARGGNARASHRARTRSQTRVRCPSRASAPARRRREIHRPLGGTPPLRDAALALTRGTVTTARAAPRAHGSGPRVEPGGARHGQHALAVGGAAWLRGPAALGDRIAGRNSPPSRGTCSRAAPRRRTPWSRAPGTTWCWSEAPTRSALSPIRHARDASVVSPPHPLRTMSHRPLPCCHSRAHRHAPQR